MAETKNTLLLNSLLEYFDRKINMESLVEILQDRSLVSLRMIDWFVTKYARKHSTYYVVEGKNFSVYTNYKSQLKAYSKKQMDPFCRRDRVLLSKHGSEIITTIGQMNFFRWAIENRILKYIYDNYDILDKEMKTDNKQSLSRKKTPANIPKRSFTRTNTSTVVSFD
jgi:hypothetical protein|tara:strand:- start:11080 stop:11580 length:501 start_codon:yes stop_codon:yes gene_type:complete